MERTNETDCTCNYCIWYLKTIYGSMGVRTVMFEGVEVVTTNPITNWSEVLENGN